MMKPIELRDLTNTVILTSTVEVADAFPEVILWNNATFVLKAVYKGSGLGSYRKATTASLEVPPSP